MTDQHILLSTMTDQQILKLIGQVRSILWGEHEFLTAAKSIEIEGLLIELKMHAQDAGKWDIAEECEDVLDQL